MAKVLQITPDELDELLRSAEVLMPALSSRGDGGLAQSIRETSARLVAMDNDWNGFSIEEVAARSFKAVYRRIGSGDYDRKDEHDIQAAAAEMAEIAGWALADAEKFTAARRFTQEALLLAQLSGDKKIELLILQNMGMLAGWVDRPREELGIARSAIEQRRLSPRIEAMFRMREAMGLAALQQESEAGRTFERARSLLQEGETAGDPGWTWWVTGRQIDTQQGFALGKTAAAIPYLQRAVIEITGSSHGAMGYGGFSAVRLLSCFLEIGAWRDAEALAAEIIPATSEIASGRTLRILGGILRDEKPLPVNLRDALCQIESELSDEDPYTL